MEIVGTVTRNTTVFESVTVVVSLPVTLYDPAASVGTAKGQENSPLEFVVTLDPTLEQFRLLLVGTSGTPAKVTLATASGVNPDPLTVNAAPTGPWAGMTVIVGPAPKAWKGALDAAPGAVEPD